jgi:hypothetical protein
VQGWEGSDELVAAFARWAASQRTVSAAASRARERSLREQAAASATWTGTLVDLAEQRALVTVAVMNQRRRGRLVGVGRDFFVLDAEGSGRAHLISLNAVSALWPDGPNAGFSAGTRRGALDLTLIMALGLLAEQRAPISVLTGAGIETAGELLTVGEDMLTLRTEAPPRRLAFVPLSAVARCELR